MAPGLRTSAEYILISIVLYIFVLSPYLHPYLSPSLSGRAPPVTSFEKLDTLVKPDTDIKCPDHTYTTHILSTDPLVIVIPSFLSSSESDELVASASSHFEPSTIWNAGVESHDPTIRNSSKALLERTTTVRCIEARARGFQGWRQDVYVERLWAQRYLPGGHYAHHFDWSNVGRDGSGRVSTFMVYLAAECTGGGTNFPRLEMPGDERWCEFVECDGRHEGVTFKARKGAAVYWENFRSDGSGDERTLHAGLPVESGSKVGLNIWSWRAPNLDGARSAWEEP